MSSKQNKKIEKLNIPNVREMIGIREPDGSNFLELKIVGKKINEIIDIINEQIAFPLIQLSSPVEVGKGELNEIEIRTIVRFMENPSDELNESEKKLLSKLQSMIKESE